MTRRTTPPAGEIAGAAIGRLGGRQDVGRGASSESVTLARHVSDNLVDFLQLHQMTLLISRRWVSYDFVYLLPLHNI